MTSYLISYLIDVSSRRGAPELWWPRTSGEAQSVCPTRRSRMLSAGPARAPRTVADVPVRGTRYHRTCSRYRHGPPLHTAAELEPTIIVQGCVVSEDRSPDSRTRHWRLERLRDGRSHLTMAVVPGPPDPEPMHLPSLHAGPAIDGEARSWRISVLSRLGTVPL